ncbi:hypothetical protein [Kingella kingae]|uniref:hypothetical protein n=1 Tax=Kingella kingae TaxID=504 RepID=UPI002550B898|nr:hypothetical protein [Kingella kingae]MDK4615575.1 hypothetical protein [Kingella kingae]MDK4631522.1 hypothetical protein [Kingella kingae]
MFSKLRKLALSASRSILFSGYLKFRSTFGLADLTLIDIAPKAACTQYNLTFSLTTPKMRSFSLICR